VGDIDLVAVGRGPGPNRVDVLVSLARPDRPFHVLATSGMSALRMNVPTRRCACPAHPDRVELAMALPRDWALVGMEHRRSAASWPIRYLEELAHYPHVHGTHFDVGHTFGVADPHDAYIEGTSYAGAILRAISGRCAAASSWLEVLREGLERRRTNARPRGAPLR
jgi:hypothetical protein